MTTKALKKKKRKTKKGNKKIKTTWDRTVKLSE